MSLGAITTSPDTVSDPGINIAPPTTSSASNVDKLIGFDSAIGSNPYYFSRVASGGPHGWYSTSAPSTGCQSATMDINIPRNVQLLAYLDNLTHAAIPGYGGSLGGNNGKYGQWGMRQILTEIFDYIRLTDLLDSHFVNVTYGWTWENWVHTSAPFVYGDPWEQPGFGGYAFGPAQVVPSYYSTWGTTGEGTLPVLTEVTLHFVALGDSSNPILAHEWKGVPNANDPGILGLPVPYDDVNITTAADGSSGQVATGRVAIQAFIYTQWVFPAAFHLTQGPALNFSVAGLNAFDISTPGQTTSFSIGGTHINPNPATCLQFTANDHIRMDWAASQGPWGIPFCTGYYPAYGNVGSQSNNRYLSPTPNWYTINGNGGDISAPTSYTFPFYSSVFTVPAGSNLVLKPATITVSLYNGAYPFWPVSSPVPIPPPIGDPNLYASYTVNIPASTLSAPIVDPGGYRIIGTQAGGTGGGPSTDERWWASQSTTFNPQTFIDINPITNTTYDVAKSIVLSPSWQDARMLAGNSLNPVPAEAYSTHPLWNTLSNMLAHTLTTSGMAWMPGATQTPLVWGVAAAMGAGQYKVAPYASPWITVSTSGGSPGAILNGHVGAYTNSGAPGDWDNGIGWWGDGPWINKADEGSFNIAQNISGLTIPYFASGNMNSQTSFQAVFSPNKEIPSPGMFGSLPTGVPEINSSGTVMLPPEPYQTLLFRPGPASAGGPFPHAGEAGYQRDGTTLTGAPPDHVLMDLFWMPVAEPYPISEPFSTAGKINLNYQILPFTYIKRATALRAALAAERIAKTPASDVNSYKIGAMGQGNNFVTDKVTRRLALNLDETTSQFDTKFASGDIFHSASQICDIFLVPQGYTYANFPAKWYDLSSGGDFALVGDNVRERPYTDIYQKVTTKSNTYTVYYRVQSLKQPVTANHAVWNEFNGSVTGEYRGSTTIERFIDPNEKNSAGATIIPDVATTLPATILPTTPNLESYYKWRVVENHQFSP